MKETIKLIRTIVIAVAICVVGYFALQLVNGKNAASEETIINSITVESVLESANEMVSSHYKYTDYEIIERDKQLWGKKIPLTTDRSLLVYSGDISLGIDMKDLTYKVNESTKTITITLPEVKILSHQLDENSFQVFDLQKSIFTQMDMTDYSQIMAGVKEKQEDLVLSDEEQMSRIKDNAKKSIEALFEATGCAEGYKVTFR